MTTKPKARKFRIRRSPGATDLPGSGDDGLSATPPEAEHAPEAERPQSLAERRAMTLERLRAQSPEEAHPTRRPTPQPARADAPGPAPAPGPAANAEAPQGRVTPTRPAPRPEAEEAPRATSRPAPPPETEAAPQPRPQPAPEPLHPRSLPPRGAGQPPLREGDVSAPGEIRAEEDLDAIRKEGLTGRQLRMARRVAQKHGLAPTSDFDAVRLLRARGIDPFKRANMLEVLPQNSGKALSPTEGDGVALPQTVPAGPGGAQLPAQAVPRKAPPPGGLSERRQREIMEIQRDISRRRRRKTLQLLTRLTFFVFLPTLLAGYYYYRVATPMYAAKSEFLILQADATSAGPLGGLLSGTQFATNQDSIAVQSYLQSKDAMVRLNEDQDFAGHFANPAIDPIQRLPPDPSTEEAYKVYKKYVKIGYDPTEGVIKMEVAAEDPETAAEFSRQLIAYAEQRVDELSLRKRDDAMQSARESLERAKAERREAQEALVRLQEGTLVDPEAVIGTLRTQISTYEIQLQEKELQLAALMDNARPNQARVDGVQADIDRLNQLLERLNARMTEARSDGASLAADTAQIQMAQADLATADLFLQSALQNEKQTELEANRQVRYLTTSVRPVAPEDPTYPRAFENTILVFLVLSGAYLMISLTMAILREQVSS